ncbi:MAG: Vms1/Ankzf1 family peptidyl-tRNA hydrolase [Actinomycetes bacterium]
MNLSFLTPLYGLGSPVASCYLDTSWDVEDAEHAIALRWRAMRDALAAHGADHATVRAMEDAVAADPPVPGAHGRALFAAEGRMLLDYHLPAPPQAQAADVGMVPHVMPLVMALAETVPHVLVATDRVGADITAYGPNGDTEVERHVDGSADDITKHRAGGFRGWSQHRYAQRVENAWEHNAKQVATEVDRLVVSTGSRVLLVGGDVRARAALRGHLGKRSLAVLREAEACDRRDVRSTQERLSVESRRLVADLTTADRRTSLARFARERDHSGRAAEGLAPVAAALCRGQVDSLLVREAPLATARLWVGPEPSQVTADPAELRALGIDDPTPVRADAALVRAVVATHASLVPVPAVVSPDEVPLDDGVGALLRYADSSTQG